MSQAEASKPLAVRLPDSLLEEYTKLAKDRQTSRNALMVEALATYAVILKAGFAAFRDRRGEGAASSSREPLS